MDPQIRIIHQLVPELWFFKSSVIYPLYFFSHVFPPLFVLSLLFNSILLFYLSLCLFLLNLSFFAELYLVSISFLFFYINLVSKFVKKRKERNPVFRFGAKIQLQFRFGSAQTHICIQIWILYQKNNSAEIKRKQK